MGPLRVHPENPRYFADRTGRALYVTGFHTWNNLVDMGPSDPPAAFEYDRYLEELERTNQNFIRLWALHLLTAWKDKDWVGQFPWQRTGPGEAVDGKPRFNLEQLDAAYFARLRERVAKARAKRIYVSVMLFEGWDAILSNRVRPDMFCFAGANNVNGVDITSSACDGTLRGWVTLDDPKVLELQERYVRRVIEEVNEYDNVLFEICNEAGKDSHDWQDHLMQYVRDVERSLPLQHCVGQTGGMGTLNQRTYQSGADWVSPEAMAMDGFASEYMSGACTWGEMRYDPGDKPVLLDTDHLWGIGGSVDWAYKVFCRGYHVLYMDKCTDYPSTFYEEAAYPGPSNLEVRRALGTIKSFADRLDLARTRPCTDRASSGYCLSDGRQWLVYAPEGQVAANADEGIYVATFFDPVEGAVLREERVQGDRFLWLQVPGAKPVVVHLTPS